MINYYFEENLIKYLKDIDSFKVFNNGETKIIRKKDKAFYTLIENLKFVFTIGISAPAFGVSLHDETIQAISKDCWLQINYSNKKFFNGLEFEALLFKLEHTGGFNLIRLNNNLYEGRCLYINLPQEIDLHNIIKF